MGLLKLIFGKKPKPVEPLPEAQPATQPATVDVHPVTYGIAPSATVEGLTIESVQEMQSLALQLARQTALYEHHANAVEVSIELAQRLYGRQIQHQSRLQDLRLSRFPIDLMSAELIAPQQPQVPTNTELRRSSVKAQARKILDD